MHISLKYPLKYRFSHDSSPASEMDIWSGCTSRHTNATLLSAPQIRPRTAAPAHRGRCWVEQMYFGTHFKLLWRRYPSVQPTSPLAGNEPANGGASRASSSFHCATSSTMHEVRSSSVKGWGEQQGAAPSPQRRHHQPCASSPRRCSTASHAASQRSHEAAAVSLSHPSPPAIAPILSAEEAPTPRRDPTAAALVEEARLRSSGEVAGSDPGSSSAAWWRDLAETLEPRMSELPAASLVSLLCSLARSKVVVPGQPTMACLILAEILPSLGGLSPRELAELLWASTELQLRPSQPWMEGYLTAVEMQLHSFSGSQLVSISASLAKVRHQVYSWPCFCALMENNRLRLCCVHRQSCPSPPRYATSWPWQPLLSSRI